MITLISGRSGYGKTMRLWQQLKNDVNAKRAQRYILLVPEQFSFCAEKELVNFLDNKLAVNIEVASFSKLAQEVLGNSGLLGNSFSSEFEHNLKNMLIASIFPMIKPSLTYYNFCSNHSDLCKAFVTTIQKLKQDHITPEDLQKSAKSLPHILASKLADLAIITKAYNQAVLGLSQDDYLSTACEILPGFTFFQNANFYIDSFNSFSKVELNFLEQIMKYSNLFITLTQDSSSHKSDVFFEAAKIQNWLEKKASQNQILIDSSILLSTPKRFKNPELKHLEQNILESYPKQFTSRTENICITQATSRHEEITCVCVQICKLVKENNYRFKEILVLARNISEYRDIIKSEFEKYNICYFEDRRTPLKNRPLFRLVLSLLAVIKSHFNPDSVHDLAKNPLLGFNPQDLWLLKFRFSQTNKTPRNDSIRTSCLKTPSFEISKHFELIFHKVFDPIRELPQNLNAKELASFVFEYIKKTGAYHKLQDLARHESNINAQQEMIGSYKKLVQILEEFVQFSELFSDMILHKEIEMLEICIESASLGANSQGLDQVLIGSSSRIKPYNPRAVFLIGVNAGIFPCFGSNNALFSPEEVSYLAESELGREEYQPEHLTYLQNFKIHQVYSEDYLFYCGLTSACEKVFVSFSELGSNNTPLRPSSYIERIQKLFPHLQILSCNQRFELLDFIQTPKLALENLCEQQNRTASDSALHELLNHEFLKDRILIAKFDWIKNNNKFKILDPKTLKSLNKRTWTLSATALETFKICRFKGFCREILKLSVIQNTKIQKSDMGSILHSILSEILVKFYGNQTLLSNLKTSIDAAAKLVNALKTEETQIKNTISLKINNYFKQELGIQKLTEREKYFRHQIVETAFLALKKIASELQTSKFTPALFEFKVFKELKNKLNVKLVGVIDRVDLLFLDGKLWLRVIDYKSGSTQFNFGDICNGIGIQTLFYLKLLVEQGHTQNRQFFPAGALNLPISHEFIALKSENYIKEDLANRMNGIVVDDIRILRMMEPELLGKLIPVTQTKDLELSEASSVFSLPQFEMLSAHIDALINEQLDFISQGNFEANPMKLRLADPCEYCEFIGICRSSNCDKTTKIKSCNKSSFWSYLEERLAERKVPNE